jgi:muramoyltetrapeptide carboxypeptidase LdcA involved in peptidoglycan recycling
MVTKPRHLAKDMTVGLVSPASNANEDEAILASIDFVRSLGFKVKASPNLFARAQYLAGSDEQRAEISILFSLTQRLMLFFVHGVVMVLREYLGSWTMMLSH